MAITRYWTLRNDRVSSFALLETRPTSSWRIGCCRTSRSRLRRRMTRLSKQVAVITGPNNGLFLFHAPGPTGPWVPHSGNPVRRGLRGSRPAGTPVHPQGTVVSTRDGFPTHLWEADPTA